jgi:uncharacterized protein YndB with AHSA1/START domain
MRIETCLASQAEGRMVMPADTLISDPIGSMTHAVTINAPIERVWPWLAQMGAGRAGWYSYDWIDNGGQPSAETILEEYQQIAPGDVLPALPGATDAFIVAEVDVPRHLVLTVPDAGGGEQVSWEFLLEPVEPGSTRLIVRARISANWPAPTGDRTEPSGDPVLIERIYALLARTPKTILLAVAGIGHYLMESKMLRGVKRRAEGKRRVF